MKIRFGIMGVIFLIIVAVGIAEFIVSARWQRFYFTAGIPLFKKSIPLSDPPELSDNCLNTRPDGIFFRPLRFKQISSNEVAFREEFFRFPIISYAPIMHGLIRYDERTEQLQIIGFANWFAPLFILAFIAEGLSLQTSEASSDVVFTVVPLALFAFLYVVQYWRFVGVFKKLSAKYG